MQRLYIGAVRLIAETASSPKSTPAARESNIRRSALITLDMVAPTSIEWYFFLIIQDYAPYNTIIMFLKKWADAVQPTPAIPNPRHLRAKERLPCGVR